MMWTGDSLFNALGHNGHTFTAAATTPILSCILTTATTFSEQHRCNRGGPAPAGR